MIEHLSGGYAWIHAEILRQVSQRSTQRLRVRDDVEAIELDATRGRNLECGDAPHQCRLASPVRAQQAEHAPWHIKGD